jgi:hypothetical protein
MIKVLLITIISVAYVIIIMTLEHVGVTEPTVYSSLGLFTGYLLCAVIIHVRVENME